MNGDRIAALAGTSVAAVIFLALIVGGGIPFSFSGKAQISDIRQSVAQDAVSQYFMVRDHGSTIDMCVRAGQVAEAYLQGQNEAMYAAWKAIQRTDCTRAGVPT